MIQDNQFSSHSSATAYIGLQNPDLSISPDLLWSIIQNNFAQVAWRRAVLPKKHIARVAQKTDETDEKPTFPTYNKNKFTGSPAYKELKNLIMVILTSQISQKGNS